MQRVSRWWPPILVLAVLVLSVGLVVAWVNVLGGEDTAAPATESVSVVSAQNAAITSELVRRMTTLLEQLPPEQHDGHGGHAGTATVTTVCGARVYGYEPVDAATADDVVTVYGFHMCGLAEPGLPWERAMKLVAPLVIRYDRTPPQIRMAESAAGVSYRDRVKQLFPAQYQRSAFEEALGAAGLADLRRRYAAAAGA